MGRKNRIKICAEDFFIIAPQEATNPYILFETMKNFVNDLLEECTEVKNLIQFPSSDAIACLEQKDETEMKKEDNSVLENDEEEYIYGEDDEDFYQEESYEEQDYYDYRDTYDAIELEERCFDLAEQFEKDSRFFNWKKTKKESATYRPKQSDKVMKHPKFAKAEKQIRQANQADRGKLAHYEAQKANIEKRIGKLRTGHVLSFITNKPTDQIIHNATTNQTVDPTIYPELSRAIETSKREYERELQKNLKNEKKNEKRQNSEASPVLTQTLIQELQSRELTPEDYELLLLLDASVAPKTLPTTQVQSFPTLKFNKKSDNLKFEIIVCAICLTDFEENDELKELPCKHYFHSDCITQWLSKSSTTCPVDNVSLKT